MTTAQSLSAPQDINGQSYPAIRVAAVHSANLAANTAVAYVLLPQTKVIRICGASDVFAHIAPSGDALPANDALVAALHFQDFVVYPGDKVSLVSILGGWASVTELA